MAQHVLVVGGTGFIGEYVVDALLREKEVAITAVHHHELAPEDERRGATYAHIDLARNPSALAAHIQEHTVVMWLMPPVEGVLRQTLEHLTRTPARFLYASTALLYPEGTVPCDETSMLAPRSAYEHAKYAEEQLVAGLSKGTTKCTIARLGNVYGDVKNTGIVSVLMKNARSGEITDITGDGSQGRDFIYVEDVASMLVSLALRSPREALEIFNVCTGTSHSINALVEHVRAVTGADVPVRYSRESEPEKGDIRVNNRRVLAELGASALLSLEKGIKKTYARYL